MLETLVAPRIRRTLLEHILTHSHDRFYLRGLAKDLNVPVSPLRRELKRLERAGMLRAIPEGNMLFYTVNVASPAFIQLEHAGQTIASPSTAELLRVQGPGLEAHIQNSEPRIPSPEHVSIWRHPLGLPILIGTAVVGMAVVLTVAGLSSMKLMNRRVAAHASPVLESRQANVTVAVPPASSSNIMRGSRWQLVPGGFGGFNSNSNNSGSF